jgi:hypothetical protein
MNQNTHIMAKNEFKDGRDFINWSAVSRLLSGEAQNIRRNQIPKKYKASINDLASKIDNWISEQKGNK